MSSNLVWYYTRDYNKSHFWLTLFFFVRVIKVLFSLPWILCAESDGMFLHEAKQILKTILLISYKQSRSRTLKKVFSRFSDNSVQVHSNVQLLYLLLFYIISCNNNLKANKPIKIQKFLWQRWRHELSVHAWIVTLSVSLFAFSPSYFI